MNCPKKNRGNYTKYKMKGFTLVELLVVIAIISVLSTIGLTVFNSAQSSARDTKRKADIDAIAQALEINKDPSGYYLNPVGSQFTGGNVPLDPLQTSIDDWSANTCGTVTEGDSYTSKCWYCKSITRTSAGNCAGPDWAAGDSNWASGVTSWWVCANLESGNPSYYCKSSQQ